DARGAVAQGLPERAGGVTFRRPPNPGAGLTRPRDVAVRDADDMETGAARGLGEKDRAKLAGADNAYSHVIAGFRVSRHLGKQVNADMTLWDSRELEN